MVVVEGGVLVAGAGRSLAKLAGIAGRKLANQATFRWRVSRRVRKRVEFQVRWRTYRRWLKTISADELATPVEKVQAPLAKRLDDALSTADNNWGDAYNHLSRSLQLVKLAYPAIAAALNEDDQAALSESWAQERSTTVLDHLYRLSGPGAALSSQDLGELLLKKSDGRRTVRLQAFNLRKHQLAPYFDKVTCPQVALGQVVTLIGGFGSGKSETAETWHRAAIDALFSDENAPFPVWLSARDLLGQSLERSVDEQVGSTWRRGRGASLAVDGVDETDPKTAQYLLEEARRLAASYDNIRVLLTARPGILSPSESEETSIEPLSPAVALELVALAGGTSTATWGWTQDIRDTVTSPFFALAAGTMLGRHDPPRGKADLIRNLVEDVLDSGAERSVVTSKETRSVLEELAVGLTRTGRDSLTFGDRQIAKSSRLIADGRAGTVAFTLPIFQQWFAAQSVLAEESLAKEVVRDVHSFNRWRWAASIALLSANTPDAVDNLVGTWVTGNPGAAAWILKEAFGDRRSGGRMSEDQELDPKTSKRRVLTALSTWMDALGPLASTIMALPDVEDPGCMQLDVAVSGRQVILTVSVSDTDGDEGAETSPGGDRVAAVPLANVLLRVGRFAPQGEAWPWDMVRQMIAEGTNPRLSTDPYLGAPEGVWSHERRFDLAKRLLDKSQNYRGHLQANMVRARALEVLDEIDHNSDSKLPWPYNRNVSYWGFELQQLITWIEDAGLDTVPSPLPSGDAPEPIGGWISHNYSPNRLREFVAEVYANACDAYDEALAHAFSRLDWSMSNSALAPFGVIIEMQAGAQSAPGHVPGISVMQVPVEMMPIRSTSDGGEVWSASGRVVVTYPKDTQNSHLDRVTEEIDKVYSWLSEREREPISGVSWTNTRANDMFNARPASSIAADWLWHDLTAIGLGRGSRPQLH